MIREDFGQGIYHVEITSKSSPQIIVVGMDDHRVRHIDNSKAGVDNVPRKLLVLTHDQALIERMCE